MIYYPVDSIQLLNNWGQGSILLIRSVFKHFHSGKRIQEGSDSYRGFTGNVWTEAESREKKLQSQKYPDTCGWSYGSEDVSKR